MDNTFTKSVPTTDAEYMAECEAMLAEIKGYETAFDKLQAEIEAMQAAAERRDAQGDALQAEIDRLKRKIWGPK